MTTTYYRQPNNTTCGQTSVAMALGITVEQSIKAFGHSGPTRATERADIVRQLGGSAGPVTPFNGQQLPEMALVRIAFRRRHPKSKDGFSKRVRRTGHCVLWADGRIYDPARPERTTLDLARGEIIDTFMAVSKPQPKPAPVALSVVEAAFAALPELLTCPRCVAMKPKSEFGVRVVKKDELGAPVKAIRQSYCRSCR